MQNLLSDLKELFKQDDRLIVDDNLLKNKIIELALKLDENLIRLLLSHSRLRQHFLADIDGVLVFDKEKFLQFVSNKAFLPDSYTAFSNKIGLTDDSGATYLSRHRDVALVWPYKDCVLEGGQTKEEAKRDEIFWNTTLAPDDIDRLLDPKVLTNFQRIDADGEHPVKRIADTDNLIIKGNNLLALHSLKRRFGSRVKLIYIDPPYNTGNDSFGYNDRFNHSTWLTFMKNRLDVARELLRRDGVIFVQCDDNEQAYLKVLMDEVFGRNNYVSQISWQRSPEITFLGQGQVEINNIVEYLLVYSKSENLALNQVSKELPATSKVIAQYPLLVEFGKKQLVKEEENPNNQTPVKFYRYRDFSVTRIPKDKATPEFYEENFDSIYRHARVNPDNSFLYSLLSKVEAKELWSISYEASAGRSAGEIIEVLLHKDNQLWAASNNAFVRDGVIYRDADMSNWWTNDEITATRIANEGGVKLGRGKKPEELLSRVIKIGTKPGELVLDFFLGTGTTAAVAHKLDRQYIGIEQLEYGENDSTVRLKNVINGDQTGISGQVHWQGGGDFVVCELMQWNERYVDQIQAAQSAKELQALWETLQVDAFLSYKVDLDQFDDHIEQFAQLSLADQKRLLLEVLDKNQLYVNLSEIDDTDYQVSKEDKRLNRQFYEQE